MHPPEISKLQARLSELPPLEDPTAYALLRDATVFARKTFGEESPHVAELQSVMFKHPTIVYNTGHYKIKEEWSSGVQHFRSILNSMEYEIWLSSKKTTEIEPPTKITVQWLFKHVPISLWSSALAVIAAAFAAGYSSGTSNLIPKVVAIVKSAFAAP